MSLIVAVQHREGWLLAADSIHRVNELRVPGPPKIDTIGSWQVGHVGGSDDSYAYLRGLIGTEELDRPSFHIDRMKWWREQCAAMSEDSANPVKPDLIMLFAKNKTCFSVNGPTGQLCPVERYGAIGCAQDMVLLLLYEALGLDGRLPESGRAVAVATDVITRVAAVDTRIALPVVWLESASSDV